jgi:hypothetical protein
MAFTIKVNGDVRRAAVRFASNQFYNRSRGGGPGAPAEWRDRNTVEDQNQSTRDDRCSAIT